MGSKSGIAIPAVETLAEACPLTSRRALKELASELLVVTGNALRTRISQHVDHVQHARRENEFIDTRTCGHVADACHRLLDQVGALPTREQHIAFLAVLYFVTPQDGEDDLSSPVGFEDDAKVLQAALKLLQLDHLWSDSA